MTLSSGQYIETATMIWMAGMRASPLTAQIPPLAIGPDEADQAGCAVDRLDRTLHVANVDDVEEFRERRLDCVSGLGSYSLTPPPHGPKWHPGNHRAARRRHTRREPRATHWLAAWTRPSGRCARCVNSIRRCAPPTLRIGFRFTGRKIWPRSPAACARPGCPNSVCALPIPL